MSGVDYTRVPIPEFTVGVDCDYSGDSEVFCRWEEAVTESGSAYNTDCGNTQTFTRDTPYNNGYAYCPYCGRRILDMADKENTDE